MHSDHNITSYYSAHRLKFHNNNSYHLITYKSREYQWIDGTKQLNQMTNWAIDYQIFKYAQRKSSSGNTRYITAKAIRNMFCRWSSPICDLNKNAQLVIIGKVSSQIKR